MEEVTRVSSSLAPPRERVHSVLWVLRLFVAMIPWGVLGLLKAAARGERPERWLLKGWHS